MAAPLPRRPPIGDRTGRPAAGATPHRPHLDDPTRGPDHPRSSAPGHFSLDGAPYGEVRRDQQDDRPADLEAPPGPPPRRPGTRELSTEYGIRSAGHGLRGAVPRSAGPGDGVLGRPLEDHGSGWGTFDARCPGAAGGDGSGLPDFPTGGGSRGPARTRRPPCGRHARACLGAGGPPMADPPPSVHRAPPSTDRKFAESDRPSPPRARPTEGPYRHSRERRSAPSRGPPLLLARGKPDEPAALDSDGGGDPGSGGCRREYRRLLLDRELTFMGPPSPRSRDATPTGYAIAGCPSAR